jgi:hypothetical protein
MDRAVHNSDAFDSAVAEFSRPWFAWIRVCRTSEGRLPNGDGHRSDRSPAQRKYDMQWRSRL